MLKLQIFPYACLFAFFITTGDKAHTENDTSVHALNVNHQEII